MDEWWFQTGRIDPRREDFVLDDLVVAFPDAATLRRFERALDRHTGRQGPIMDWQAHRIEGGRVELGVSERHGSRMGTTLAEWMDGRPLGSVACDDRRRYTPAEALHRIGIA